MNPGVVALERDHLLHAARHVRIVEELRLLIVERLGHAARDLLLREKEWLHEIVSLGNSQQGDRYIFSGQIFVTFTFSASLCTAETDLASPSDMTEGPSLFLQYKGLQKK